MGMLPSLNGGDAERPSWSRCGLALCSCLQPLDAVEPECPLCPGYGLAEPTHDRVPTLTMRYEASMQLPMSLLVGSFGLVVVLGARRDPERAEPDPDRKPRRTAEAADSRALSIETPPPRA